MRGYETIVGGQSLSQNKLRIPMRGYETGCDSGRTTNFSSLRIPMRGYELSNTEYAIFVQ